MDYQSANSFLHSQGIQEGIDYDPNGVNFEMVKIPFGLLTIINTQFIKSGWFVVEKGRDEVDPNYLYISIFPAAIIRVKVKVKSDGTGAIWYKTNDIFTVKRTDNAKLYSIVSPEYLKGKTVLVDHVDVIEIMN